MHPRPIRVVPLIVVNGSITVSWPISTSTSMTVLSGSTIETPASMWRSWIAAWASLRTRARATRSLTPRTSRGSSTTLASIRSPLVPQQGQDLGQIELALGVVGGQPRERLPQSAGREGEDAGVDLVDPELGLARVTGALGLDDPLHGRRRRPARRVRSRSGPRSTVLAIVAAAPEAAWAATNASIACGLTSGTSPERTTTAPSRSPPEAPSRASMAALTAPPVPFAVGWTASSTPSGRCGSSTRSGESTTRTRSAPARRAARTGHSSIGTPHRSCRTFGVRECMRVPWPAARIRTVGAATAPDDANRAPRRCPTAAGHRPGSPARPGGGRRAHGRALGGRRYWGTWTRTRT